MNSASQENSLATEIVEEANNSREPPPENLAMTNLSTENCNDSETDSDSTILIKNSGDEQDINEEDDLFVESVKLKNKTFKLDVPKTENQEQQSASTSINNGKRSYSVMKDEDEQVCSICLDSWTNDGEHRLSSLKCGHLFGKSCIFNWLVKQKKHFCPQCNKKACSYDIRELFATKLIALDCSEKSKLEREIEIVKEEKRKVEAELAKCRIYAENFKQELNRVRIELDKFTGKSDCDSKPKVIKFYLEKTIPIHNGCCRVCMYDSFNRRLLVCHQSKNPLFPGFGIKKIYNLGTEYNGNNFLHLHSKAMRDIRFHPFKPNTILTVAFDKCAKICDLDKQSVIQTFSADYALWSCCWDEEDPNFFYVGTGKGTVYVYDIRCSTTPVKELKLTGDTSSVVSICFVPPKPPNNGGIICCRLNSVVYYKKSDSQEFVPCRFNALVGPFFSLIFNTESNHVVVSCRPSISIPHVRHVYCEVNEEECQPIHVFIGGTVQSMLSRPCFVKSNEETLVAVFQENYSSVELWSTSSGLKVYSFRVSEEVFDLTFIKIGERAFIVTIASSAVRFYEASHF